MLLKTFYIVFWHLRIKMAPKKAPRSALEVLIEKVRATYVGDTALGVKLGELGQYSKKFLEDMLEADPRR